MWSPYKGPTRLWDLRFYIFVYICMISLVSAENEIWPLDRPDGMPTIISLEVMCGKDHMDVHLKFSHPFEGIVSSKGQHSDPRCIYVPASSGKKYFSFRISYTRCGTKPDLHGQFYENTIVVQYDKDLLEVWDEAKRLRCEWYNDYEKTASKPPMVIADLDVIQLDFRGDNVDCWMEIQHGKGPWAPPVSGIVPLGSTLTLVVAINDFHGEFDMRVKSCAASDGAGHLIKLSDEYGCVLRPKMISHFLKARAPDNRATVITYAFFHAFKFPDAISVHIKCKVEICRHGCLDHCQSYDNLHERKDTFGKMNAPENNNQLDLDDEDDNLDTLSEIGVAGIHSQLNPMSLMKQKEKYNINKRPPEVHEDIDDIPPDVNMNNNNNQNVNVNVDGGGGDDDDDVDELLKFLNDGEKINDDDDDQFPHGPRYLEQKDRMGTPAIAGPRSLNFDDTTDTHIYGSSENTSKLVYKRRIRSIVISDDDKQSNTDIGVSGLYDVISETDLAFTPDHKQESVTIFQGKISEEVVYGICMPVPGFSVLFILVIAATIVSALVAGSLLYRYQLQKETLNQQQQVDGTTNVNNGFGTWMNLRLFRMKHICSNNTIPAITTTPTTANSIKPQ